MLRPPSRHLVQGSSFHYFYYRVLNRPNRRQVGSPEKNRHRPRCFSRSARGQNADQPCLFGAGVSRYRPDLGFCNYSGTRLCSGRYAHDGGQKRQNYRRLDLWQMENHFPDGRFVDYSTQPHHEPRPIYHSRQFFPLSFTNTHDFLRRRLSNQRLPRSY